MPVIDVVIVRREDTPPWPELEHVLHLPDPLWYLVALEAGMTSGAPSLALRITLPDGRELIAETSLNAWIVATCALRGAFPQAFAGGPLAVRPGELNDGADGA